MACGEGVKCAVLDCLGSCTEEGGIFHIPMGIERWNPTNWSSSGVAFGTRNATDGMSLRRTQMRMYVSAISNLLRKVGTSFGGAARMH